MQDRTSANSMKGLLQRTAGPYIGSQPVLWRCPPHDRFDPPKRTSPGHAV